MTTPFAVGQLSEQVEALLADHSLRTRAVDFTQYKGRIVAFAKEILHVETLYSKQIEALEAFVAGKFTVVRGNHGSGKDFLLAIAALYAAQVDQQLVLVISATERQLLGQVWREIQNRFSAKLPGKLYTAHLEIAGEKRIIAMTSGSTSNLTGWHHKNGVCVLISESQADQVEDHAFDAAIANTVDELSRVLVVGNPVKPTGRFREICQRPHWQQIHMSAFDHPNIIEARTVIAGGPTKDWPDEVAREYGKDSAFYISRVLGDFPTDTVEGLFRRDWIRRAMDQHDANTFEDTVVQHRVRLGVDVGASFGGDQTVVAVCRGPVLEKFVTWRERDLAVTEDRLVALAQEYELATVNPKFPQLGARPVFCVDVVGVGAGIPGHLRRRGYGVIEFNGGAPARQPTKFLNARAEHYFRLKDLLVENKVAIPRDAMLEEELLATEWQTAASGRVVQVVSKDLIRKALGRSPDHCDAAVLGLVRSVYNGPSVFTTTIYT